jgi:predicted porin
MKLFKLAALALLSAATSAHAQSNVTVYGVLDAYTGQIKNTGGSAAQGSVIALNSGGLTTSFIGFRGVEELGGGLKAVFALESYVRIDTGVIGRNDADPLWGRAANVGIEGGFGRLTLGRHVTPYSLATTTITPLVGTTAISPAFSAIFRNNLQGDTRFNNSVRYTSPSMQGLVADVVASTGREAGPGPDLRRDRAVDASLKYVKGKWVAITALRVINLNSGSDDHRQKAYMAGASYDFGAARVNLQLHDIRERYAASAKDVKRQSWEIGAAIPMGSGEIDLSYASTDMEHGLGAALPSKRNSYVLMYDHNLSKRTDAYIAFYKDRLKEPSVIQQIAAVGLRHKF